MEIQYISVKETKDLFNMRIRLEELCVFLKLGKTLADFGQNLYNLIKRFDQCTRDLINAISESRRTASRSAMAYLKE